MAKPWTLVPEAPPRAACPVCGSERFERGPKGRTGPTGVPPRCSGCNSLERHRAIRLMVDALSDLDFKDWEALQFSEEPTLEPSWFRAFEVSVYGGSNSLDLCAVDRPDNTYDLILCNNVLEHVADDRAALAELTRICRHEGIVILAVPDPLFRETTDDWGYPDPEKYGHYRIYGRDFESFMAAALPDYACLSALGPDPVSGVTELAYFITESPRTEAALMAALPSVTSLNTAKKPGTAHRR